MGSLAEGCLILPLDFTTIMAWIWTHVRKSTRFWIRAALRLSMHGHSKLLCILVNQADSVSLRLLLQKENPCHYFIMEKMKDTLYLITYLSFWNLESSSKLTSLNNYTIKQISQNGCIVPLSRPNQRVSAGLNRLEWKLNSMWVIWEVFIYLDNSFSDVVVGCTSLP